MLEGSYKPQDFEEKMYEEWEKSGYFKPSMDSTKESFCIMMPPPNVTGKLHMGHALDCSIQDALIRFKRMQGYNTLWLPGSDHASISTELKVVQKIRSEGKEKKDLGRENFLEECWDWTHLYGGTIEKQQRKLGASCDWTRKRFTLDEGLSDAVVEEFIKLYKDGLIYRGKRMVNWCPECHTAVSDAEVEYHEEASHLWHIRYKIKGTDKYVEVATTRPETMLGDTAVAVHPEDVRYKDIIGKTCILPIMNKEIPIIADEFVDKEFGTGCVKITPAHDPNDYEAGLRHNLEFIEVFDDKTIMGNLWENVKGLKAIDARPIIVKELDNIGALVSIEDYTHDVGKCERCKTTIEPRISEQWFVKMKTLAEPAVKIFENGDMRFVPKKYENTYFSWMRNIKDWCISRQLWWGHQIPAYYCESCGNIHVGKEAPEKCDKCGSEKFKQDEDTLDTWFSSALWPFSTLGWPNKDAEDLKMFYPTNVLVTAYDIIFFWVARMAFSGLYAMGEKPFSDVLIHGIVRDAQGRKMSKSLGNGIDPIEIIDQYGTDALRFSLISGTTIGNDIRYMTEKLDQASNFANKIWNAAKFILMNMSDKEKIIKFREANYDKDEKKYKNDSLKIEDKWILSKLNNLIKDITQNINNYDLGIALDNIYSFIWNEFCDWYIEMVKPRLYSENEQDKICVSYVLNEVFTTSMKLLHPFMPFITTKIYRNLVKYDDKELMISDWPVESSNLKFENDELAIEKIKEAIVGIRNVRSNMNIHPSKKETLIFVTDKYINEIQEATGFILKLGFGSDIKIQKDKEGIPSNAISILADDISVYMPLEGLINFEEEKARLEKERIRLEGEVARCEKMLSNPGFVNKAPEAKINQEKEKLENYKKMLMDTINNINNLN